MIKLVACDLDGTLLNADHEISENNRQTIEKMKGKNIPFVIATGRIYPSAAEFSKALGLKTPIISCNGAVIKDPIKDEILFHYPVAKAAVYKMIEIAHRHDIYFHFYTMDTVFAERNERLIKMYQAWKAKSPEYSLVKTAIVDDLTAIVEDHTVYKLGLYTDEPLAEDALKEMLEIGGLTSCYSLSTLVDVFSEEASKGQAIKDVAGLYGMDLSEVMALGDNENDIPMLEMAGLSVAMADAKDHVKAAASEVGLSNEASGVSVAIEKHLDI